MKQEKRSTNNSNQQQLSERIRKSLVELEGEEFMLELTFDEEGGDPDAEDQTV